MSVCFDVGLVDLGLFVGLVCIPLVGCFVLISLAIVLFVLFVFGLIWNLVLIRGLTCLV